MPKNSKVIKKVIKKIENAEMGFDEVSDDAIFWDSVAYAMHYCDEEIPFDKSFDDYDAKWFNKIENKYNFIMWLKALVKAMKKEEKKSGDSL